MKPLGSKLIAVEDITGAISNTGGIDPDDLAEYVKRTGGVKGYRKGSQIDHETFLKTCAKRLCFVYSDLTLIVLAIMFGAYALVDTIFAVVGIIVGVLTFLMYHARHHGNVAALSDRTVDNRDGRLCGRV